MLIYYMKAKYCEPGYHIAPELVSSHYAGMTLSITFDYGSCSLPGGGPVCSGPSVSFEYDPASFFLRHYSAETFEGESCKLEKCFTVADGSATGFADCDLTATKLWEGPGFTIPLN